MAFTSALLAGPLVGSTANMLVVEMDAIALNLASTHLTHQQQVEQLE
jgi:hypothetical protein